MIQDTIEKGSETSGEIVQHRTARAPKLFLKAGQKEEFYEITSGGIVLRARMPQEEWLSLTEKAIKDFETTKDTHLAAMFRVGDLLAYGEREFGEEWSQAIDSARKAIRLSMKTLQNVQWICGSIKPEIRHDMLTLAHHEVVAKLKDPETQRRFLDMAEEEELSVAGLRKKVKEEFPPERRGTTGGKNKAIIDLDSEEGIAHALLKVEEFVAKLISGSEVDGEEVPPEPVYDWPDARKRSLLDTIGRLVSLVSLDEGIALQCVRSANEFLEFPDNANFKTWSDERRGEWAPGLGEIGKAARRAGFLCAPKAVKSGD